MTTGHRIELKTFRMRKRPKKTASNAKITREPFRDNPIKILPISTFIDDYNHYMGGINQLNQLRASFTIHFSRNQKEFFPGAFWAINIAVYNSYKLYLALNGSKTSSTGKRDPRQYREWVEDLVNLLFQVDNDNFGEEITSKPYLKYVYEPVLTGPKPAKKEEILKDINRFSSNYLYGENPFKKRGYYFLCSKKTILKDSKKQKSDNSLFQRTFQLDQNDLIEVDKREEPKRKRFYLKETKWWCFNYQKFICKDCWNLYH
jgi:hypothetical protein